jgi:hypothetical protein
MRRNVLLNSAGKAGVAFAIPAAVFKAVSFIWSESQLYSMA